jgi:MFS family permease
MMIRADSPRYKWILIGVLFLAASLNYADRGALTAVFPLLRKDLGMSDLALAAIGSFFLWSYALFSPLAGYLGDRFSRSALVTWSVVAWSVVTAMTAFVNTSEQLLTMRVLLGVAESLYIPASLALIAEHHATATRAMAMSLHLAGFYAGVVFGGTVAGYLGDSYGWRPALLLLGGIGLILGLLCKFTVFAVPSGMSTETISEKQPPLPFIHSLSNLVKTVSYWVLLLEAMLLAIGTWIFANWLPLYFSETFKMSLSGAGFAGTFPVQAGAMIGILAGGYLSDRVARKAVQRRMLFHSVCYLAAAPLLLAFVVSSNYAVILSAVFGYSLFRAVGGANANPLLCDLLPKTSWSTAVGLMNTTNCFAGGVGILVAGYLKRDFGLGGIFAGTAGIVLVAGVLLLLGYFLFLRKDLERSPNLAGSAPVITKNPDASSALQES